MTRFKYSLDKSSKKFQCPACDKKRFVRYVKTDTNEYCEAIYGRCDRETSCGYLCTPNEYENYRIFKPLTYLKPISFLNKDILRGSLTHYEINPFVNYLRSKIDRDIVQVAIKKYNIGTSNYYGGATVFWQIDTNGKVRTGKVMLYNQHTGKRIKNSISINWAHKLLKLQDYNLDQCLFGAHLLDQKTNKVAVVESEKTAIIMSIAKPNITWLATGSLNGFKKEMLECLKAYNVIAFPDKGCYENWNETARKLNTIGYNISVSTFAERCDSLAVGEDLADAISVTDV